MIKQCKIDNTYMVKPASDSVWKHHFNLGQNSEVYYRTGWLL